MQRILATSAAILLEGAAAYLSSPIAIEKWGFYPGVMLSGGLGIAIFLAWYSAFNAKTFLKGVAIGCLALGLITLSSFAVHTATSAPEFAKHEAARLAEQAKFDAEYIATVTKRTQSIDAAYALYQEQERARIDALGQVKLEIKATKKAKSPDIYKLLLDQQSALSNPNKAPIEPPMPVREIAVIGSGFAQANVLAMVQAGAFGLIVPVLIFLARIQPLTSKKQGVVNRVVNGISGVVNRVVNTVNDHPDKNTSEFQSPLAPKNSNTDHFFLKLIPVADDGSVTTESIQAHFGVGRRPARELRDDAVSSGYLYAKGKRYYYSSSTLEQPLNNVVSMEELSQARTRRRA